MLSAQSSPGDRQLPRGHLLVLNRSFRRTLEAENKSPRTIEAYTDAVRLLATYCQVHGHPLSSPASSNASTSRPSSPTSSLAGSRPRPTTATGACTPSSSERWPRETSRPTPWTA
jgi:hypothetical protein